jgi:hypothetical protein
MLCLYLFPVITPHSHFPENNLSQKNAVISIKPLIIIMDIVKDEEIKRIAMLDGVARCEGIDCEINQSCLRYSAAISESDREWWYFQGKYVDGHCNSYLPNGKSQCLTSSPLSSSAERISHLEYEYY